MRGVEGGASLQQVQTFWIIGGDLRQEKLAGLLRSDGHRVHTYALGEPETDLIQVEQADCVILPLPVAGPDGALNAPMSGSKHALEEILARLTPDQFICGGMVSPETATLAARYGLTVHDYFQREELIVANAVPTAEGAVQIALEEMGVTLHRAQVLLLGYGRVGKLTAHRLQALGARVTVAARSCDALAWADAYGHDTVRLSEMEEGLGGYDLVVNTVPVRLLTRERLAALKEGCLVIDLASKPGGVDFQGAAELGVRCVWALSLPGKVAPISAASALRDTIYNMLSEFS